MDNTLSMIKQEVGVMKKLDHPNIISLFEQLETPDKFYCVLEFIDGKHCDCISFFVTRKL